MTIVSPSPSQFAKGGSYRGTAARFCQVGWLVLALSWSIGFTTIGRAQNSLSESQVKALFLFNFAKYVEWPAEAFSGPNAPITIGVVGASPCAQHLQKAVEGKVVSGRPLLIRQIEKPEDRGQCHILFISDSEKRHVGEILDQVKDLPILTVGESDQFAQAGGVIGFVKKEGKVRLAIDLKAARHAKLEISSKLLSVADTVTGKE